MKRIFGLIKNYCFLFLLIYFSSGILNGQKLFEDSEKFKTFKGFSKRISGEMIEYSCFNPLARKAILTRCTTGEMKIEWETEKIPLEYSGDFIYFIWVVSYSTSTNSGDRNFHFYINGEKHFNIKTIKDRNDSTWFLRSDDGLELGFKLMQEDFVKDANGYMCLKVPTAKFKKGDPLTIKVVGELAKANDWFMTFMYDMRDKSVEVLPLPFLIGKDNMLHQSVFVGINILNSTGKAVISIDDLTKEEKELQFGFNNFEIFIPAVRSEKTITVNVIIDGVRLEPIKKKIKPVREVGFYLLPHAHVDIGYTNIQTKVLEIHVKNIYDALELIKKSENYPPESRFKWNVEVLWAVEKFFETASEENKNKFINAVKNGSIGLQGLYANLLTGVMRPEEFYKLTEYARILNKTYGFNIRSAMISDIPGMTWNMIPTLSQCGIKYFSSGPNGNFISGDRTGHSNNAWADRPFYWISPSGSEKILYWMTGYGYGSIFQGLSSKNLNKLDHFRKFESYYNWLDTISYPYDMVHMRYTINGDNGTADPELAEYAKNWNAKYTSPKIYLCTSEELFEKFEKKYGNSLPVVSGDFTPYWEDGASSTAYELGLNRNASEKLVQVEALYSLLTPQKYDESKFYEAWKNILLFDEHTWGAWNSISDPDISFVSDQWKIKQNFAFNSDKCADTLYRSIIINKSAIMKGRPEALIINPWRPNDYKEKDSRFNNSTINKTKDEVSLIDRKTKLSGNKLFFDVINTNSWERSDIVRISKNLINNYKLVKDDKGKTVTSQILSDGDLVFIAKGIPSLGSKRYSIEPGNPQFKSNLIICENTITNDNVGISIDTLTGSIKRITLKKTQTELVDNSKLTGLNEYLYVEGLNPDNAKSPGKTIIQIKEKGPVLAGFIVESDVPGCNNLKREVTLINELNKIELINILDKKNVRTKESVHFGFPFNVPEGVVRIDLGFGVFQPEVNQLAGSCKDFYSAQRWVDISNNEYGLTFTVNEAPLIEIKEMRNEDQVSFPIGWKKVQEPSTLIYSYIMNNYWHTNYKIDQSGISSYKYSIIPHGIYNQAAAVKSGIESSQPLIVRQALKKDAVISSLFTIDPKDVIVTYLKPAPDNKGYFFRLYNSSGKPEKIKIMHDKSRTLYLSSPYEDKIKKADIIELPPDGIVSLILE